MSDTLSTSREMLETIRVSCEDGYTVPPQWISALLDDFDRQSATIERLTRERDEASIAAVERMMDRDRLAAQLEKAKEVLNRITNSADGMSFRADDIRSIVGNTNWRVLRDHIDAARAFLASLDDKARG